jgi:outer membrane protein
MTRRIVLTGIALGIAASAATQPAAPDRLTLTEAVDFALKNSPVLKGSQAEIAAARAETGVARARTGPQLSLNGFAARSSMTSILSSPMGSEPPALILAPEEDFFVDGNLTLMAPIFTGSFLTGKVEAARAKEREMEAARQEMRAEVAFMVREAYLRALYGIEIVEAQKTRIEAAIAMVRVAKDQFDAGKGIQASVHRAEAELADAQRELTMADTDRRKMLLDLLEAMGASMERLPDLAERLVLSSPTTTVLESVLAAKQNRGELLAASQRVEAAKGNERSARGSQQPQLYAFAMGDTFNPADDMGKRSGYSVGLTLNFPLYDGGMRRSEVSAMRAMTDLARSEEQRVALKVEKEVRQAWLDIETAAQNYRTAESALVAAQSAYDVMVVRVESGKGIQLEQLDALAALVRARANLAQALYEHQIAVARLDRAVGLVGALPKGVQK